MAQYEIFQLLNNSFKTNFDPFGENLDFLWPIKYGQFSTI